MVEGLMEQVGATARERVEILGVGFDALTLDGAVRILADVVESRRARAVRGALEGVPTDEEASAGEENGGPFFVVTANPEIVEMARKDAELAEIIGSADMTLADGRGVVWAAGVLGRPLPGRVAGVDLAQRLIEEGGRRGWRLYVLGGRPGVAAMAAGKAAADHPGLVIAGAAHGYFGPEDDTRIVEEISNAGVDVLLVGLGAPKQEKWLWRNRSRLRAGVCVGVGGTLDVLAGVVKRAPPAFQKAGVEWLYRLATQPRRIFRMASLPMFVFHVVRSALGGSTRGDSRA